VILSSAMHSKSKISIFSIQNRRYINTWLMQAWQNTAMSLAILLSVARRRSGFTLLEISLVLLILSLMLSGVLAMLAQESRRSNAAELEMKMDAIERALASYSKRSDAYALPCPSNPELALTHADFGFAASPGCTTGSGSRAIPAAYRNASAASGTVPVRTLGLPDEYAFDPWGNKFTYMVTIAITATNILQTSAVTDNTMLQEIRLYSTDASTGFFVSATVVSHGVNGSGSFNRAGVRKSSIIRNTYEQSNCSCNGSGSLTFSNIIYYGPYDGAEADVEYQFDDVVRFYQRGFFTLSNSLVSQ